MTYIFLAFLSDRCYVIRMRRAFVLLLCRGCMTSWPHVIDAWCSAELRMQHLGLLQADFGIQLREWAAKHVYNALNPFLRVYSFITSFTQAFIQVYRLIFKDLTNILNRNFTLNAVCFHIILRMWSIHQPEWFFCCCCINQSEFQRPLHTLYSQM